MVCLSMGMLEQVFSDWTLKSENLFSGSWIPPPYHFIPDHLFVLDLQSCFFQSILIFKINLSPAISDKHLEVRRLHRWRYEGVRLSALKTCFAHIMEFYFLFMNLKSCWLGLKLCQFVDVQRWLHNKCLYFCNFTYTHLTTRSLVLSKTPRVCSGGRICPDDLKRRTSRASSIIHGLCTIDNKIRSLTDLLD